jgi:16S rRNA (guanine527-N7)-methyltransferase
VDSINKKLKVVKEVCDALGIKNVTTQHSRAEDLKPKIADLVVSRAVAPIEDLWKWSKPLLRKFSAGEAPNGLICLKGGDLTQEIFESGCKPYVWEILGMFKEPYFENKFLLYQPI